MKRKLIIATIALLVLGAASALFVHQRQANQVTLDDFRPSAQGPVPLEWRTCALACDWCTCWNMDQLHNKKLQKPDDKKDLDGEVPIE